MLEPGKIYSSCVEATAGFVQGIGFSQVVIGLSGGIDSSAVATIAVDALGASNVHGVLLPGPYSSDHSVEDANMLAENLGIDAVSIPIVNPHESFVGAIQEGAGEKLCGLAAENTQARCRMVVLMALSNAHGWLMLNTGNKSEAAMGYSTLYGDTAGAFAPLGGIYKTQVFEIARWRNEEALRLGDIQPIPERVLIKPPSAELSPDQSDEKSLGIDYPTLDSILIRYVEHGESISDICNAGFLRKQVEDVIARYEANAFKRNQEPPYPTTDFYCE